MKCQSFPCVAAVFACTLAWTLASSHAAGRVVQMDGMDVGNTMGVNTWAAFAGTADDALVVGDFAVLENELQQVLRTLRGANINIVAIHQHMTGENPRMIFLHYYGRGKALDLARGVKAAINTQPLAANN